MSGTAAGAGPSAAAAAAVTAAGGGGPPPPSLATVPDGSLSPPSAPPFADTPATSYCAASADSSTAPAVGIVAPGAAVVAVAVAIPGAGVGSSTWVMRQLSRAGSGRGARRPLNPRCRTTAFCACRAVRGF